MRRYVVLSKTVIHRSAEAMIHQRLLVQCHADAHDDATKNLAARGLGVENSAGGHSDDDAGHAHDAEFVIDLHLGEDRAVGVAGLAPVPNIVADAWPSGLFGLRPIMYRCGS